MPDPTPTMEWERDETQATVGTELNNFNLGVQEDVMRNFAKRLVACRSTAQLVSLVPAAVQERTKDILESIVQAHIKKSSAAFLLAEWRDCIAKESFVSVLELKSLRAPSIQVSKLSEKDGVLDKGFEDSLKEAKKLALMRMISIKASEIEALGKICDMEARYKEIIEIWNKASQQNDASAEASALLRHTPSIKSLIQTTVSIGENIAHKQAELREKKATVQKTTKVSATAVMPTDSKGLEEFVKEIHKRQKQSVQDRAKSKKSGKGPRGAGPSKTKNQKNSNKKVAKKGRKQRKGKRGTSSKKQQKKP